MNKIPLKVYKTTTGHWFAHYDVQEGSPVGPWRSSWSTQIEAVAALLRFAKEMKLPAIIEVEQ